MPGDDPVDEPRRRPRGPVVDIEPGIELRHIRDGELAELMNDADALRRPDYALLAAVEQQCSLRPSDLAARDEREGDS